MKNDRLYLTQKAIANALKEIMIDKNFNDVTVSEICEIAGIGRRSFYRFFPDKYAVLTWIFKDDFWDKLEDTDGWTSWDVFYVVCMFLGENRRFYSKAFTSGQNSSRDLCISYMTPYLKRDFDGVFSSEEEAVYWINLILQNTFDQFVKWLQSSDTISAEEFFQNVRESQIRVISRYNNSLAIPISDSCLEIGRKVRRRGHL